MAGTGPQNLSKPQAVIFVLLHLHLLTFWLPVAGWDTAEFSSPLESLTLIKS